MKFRRLSIHGFKSFVEPVDFLIEPGLTGVVGPNGCGKSNLVEALRWVMGENSYKNMRASGMDDVIFSGSGNRPARNSAEVMLVIDNDEKRAPAAFNDADVLEVSRRIERESGSTYRVNGREVRARDVQLLFADASTGARSPSMVRQGQIGELISAKPSQRRAVLEEAAGISGLHSRRHEAEIRLKAAETNLARLEDVLKEIESRLEALRRQARQAARYRALSGDIRKAEAIIAFLRWREAEEATAEAGRLLGASVDLMAEVEAAQAAAARDQAVSAAALPGLRDASVAAAAGLQRLRLALAESEAEERRVREAIAQLGRRAEELVRDREREAAIVADNDARLAALTEEAEVLAAGTAGEDEALAEAVARREAAEEAAVAADQRLGEATAAEAGAAARRDGLDRAVREAEDRAARLAGERQTVAAALAAIDDRLSGEGPLGEALALAEEAEARLAAAEDEAAAAEDRLSGAEAGERAARQALGEADREAQRLDTEARTLARVLDLETGALFPPLVDRLTVARGYETALAIALGEDIEAPLDARAPAHWSDPGPFDGDRPLPAGAEPLSARVTGPPETARRLAQVGLVADRSAGEALRSALSPGQVLVTAAGDLWRWDGYVAAAGAQTPAARRLASRNRLAELDEQRAVASAEAARRRDAAALAQTAARGAEAAARSAREAVKAANRGLGEAREALARAERARAELMSRRAALDERLQRLDGDMAEAGRAGAAARAERAALPDTAALTAAVQVARADLAEWRAVLAEARSLTEQLGREAAERRRRQLAIVRERESWAARVAGARAHLADLAGRLDDVEAERAGLIDRPDEIILARRGLMAAIGEAEIALRVASDNLSAAEREAGEADRRAREALARFSEVREGRGRAEERLAAASERRDSLVAEIRERFESPPFALRGLAGLDEAAPLPAAAGVEERLERLRLERERLGGVNLQAEEEAAEVADRMETLAGEREDLIEAIRRLRQGIHTLNREARERLLASFGVVNGHFQRLFTHLFGGGTADLQLIDSDDPLDAGLEILARPPGKKPQTMTLLSGGEQALTAMALIFAVFLTNPAPICVLDEVDAPLDDANVERYCDLLDEMARATDTRFVVITHNPITMARMNRLFGVTMAERGVSQLVSVDLETAGQFREAS